MNFDSSVKRQQHTKGYKILHKIFEDIVKILNYLLFFYEDPRKRNNASLNEVFNPLRNKSENVSRFCLKHTPKDLRKTKHIFFCVNNATLIKQPAL